MTEFEFTDHNWELIQFKYEILGYSIEQLAAEHKISLAVLKYNSQDWNQLPLAKTTAYENLSLQDITSLEDILEKLGNQTASQAKAFAILKQKFLGPKYVELETVLLHKAITMAANIKDNDPLGARTIRSLATVLADLLDQNPLLRPEKEDEEGFSGLREWKVNVVHTNKPEEKDDGEEK